MGVVKDKAIEFGINAALAQVHKNPEKNLPKLLDVIKKFDKDNMWEPKYEFMEKVLSDPNNNWYQYIMSILNDVEPKVVDKFVTNFIVNSAIKGIAKNHEVKAKEHCGAPWAIVMDPTTACNLKCKGCWAADYGKSLNLGYDLMDRIVREANEVGCYWFLFTGGEPLVKKDEIIRLCKEHNDSIFVAFTNATLIDQEFCDKVKEVGNISFAISIEGSEDSTDGRRGKGVYGKIMKAVDLLKKNKLLFGFSTCVTSVNYEAIMDEKYFDSLIAKGFKYGWYFNYMPVGCGSDTKLLTTPEQRKDMYYRLKEYRRTKPLFTVDFWNDGRYVGGCIAGGKHYLHINANGDVEPCVFIHYSNANIKEKSFLECLKQPLFKEYQAGQPFNDNLLRPCPLLDNSGKLTEMVKKVGAKSTDMEVPEDVEKLSKKTEQITKDWAPVADELWNEYNEEVKEKKAKAEKNLLKNKIFKLDY